MVMRTVGAAVRRTTARRVDLRAGNKQARLSAGDGFTLVELMIALSILSLLLVMSTVLLINIGAIYTKGVNAANLQNISRTLVSDTSSALQFNGVTPAGCTGVSNTEDGTGDNPHTPANPATDGTCYMGKTHQNGYDIYSYCINNIRYSYVLGRELGTDNSKTSDAQTYHVMWQDTLKNPNQACLPLNISVSQVTSDNSSLEGGNIPSKGHEVVAKNMRLTKFFIQQTAPNSRVYNISVGMAYGDNDLVVVPSNGNPYGKPLCKGDRGTQYCAASFISTTATQRVRND